MNNPNPFVPQGSLLEQEKRRSRMKLGVFIVLAVSICGLTAMLIQGCKRDTESADNNPLTPTNPPDIASTNPPSPETPTNPVAFVPPVPTNPPVVVPPVDTGTTEYTVVAGDTLGKIAKAHGVSLKALEAANPGVVPKKLKVGQKLQIPAAVSGAAAVTPDATAPTASGEEIYKVKSGDTLTKIAKQYGLSVKAIESENSLSTTKIKVGQKLKIPVKAEAATSAPAVSPAPVAPAAAPSVTPAH
jgi:LysM repeat protein